MTTIRELLDSGEEWDVSGDSISCAIYSSATYLGRSKARIVVASCDDQYGRARLAALAPRMARMLRALEWEGRRSDDYWAGDYVQCPRCEGCDEHRPDCELAALLVEFER